MEIAYRDPLQRSDHKFWPALAFSFAPSPGHSAVRDLRPNRNKPEANLGPKSARALPKSSVVFRAYRCVNQIVPREVPSPGKESLHAKDLNRVTCHCRSIDHRIQIARYRTQDASNKDWLPALFARV